VSGLVAKWVSVNVPGLGEVISLLILSGIMVIDPSSVPCLDLPWNFFAARPLEYDVKKLAKRFGSVLFGRHLTINSELARTRGIRLSN
jgi:hypothetical protein